MRLTNLAWGTKPKGGGAWIQKHLKLSLTRTFLATKQQIQKEKTLVNRSLNIQMFLKFQRVSPGRNGQARDPVLHHGVAFLWTIKVL